MQKTSSCTPDGLWPPRNRFPPTPQPQPRGPPPVRDKLRTEVWRHPNRCARRKRDGGRGRRDRPAEARGSRGEAGSGRPAQPGEGRGKPARLGHELLSDAGRGESLSQKHKETAAFARPNPEPAPGAERAIGRARLAALGEFLITKTQLAQSESSRPGPLAHPSPNSLSRSPPFKSERKKENRGFFFFFSSRMLYNDRRVPGI